MNTSNFPLPREWLEVKHMWIGINQPAFEKMKPNHTQQIKPKRLSPPKIPVEYSSNFIAPSSGFILNHSDSLLNTHFMIKMNPFAAFHKYNGWMQRGNDFLRIPFGSCCGYHFHFGAFRMTQTTAMASNGEAERWAKPATSYIWSSGSLFRPGKSRDRVQTVVAQRCFRSDMHRGRRCRCRRIWNNTQTRYSISLVNWIEQTQQTQHEKKRRWHWLRGALSGPKSTWVFLAITMTTTETHKTGERASRCCPPNVNGHPENARGFCLRNDLSSRNITRNRLLFGCSKKKDAICQTVWILRLVWMQIEHCFCCHHLNCFCCEVFCETSSEIGGFLESICLLGQLHCFSFF